MGSGHSFCPSVTARFLPKVRNYAAFTQFLYSKTALLSLTCSWSHWLEMFAEITQTSPSFPFYPLFFDSSSSVFLLPFLLIFLSLPPPSSPFPSSSSMSFILHFLFKLYFTCYFSLWHLEPQHPLSPQDWQ